MSGVALLKFNPNHEPAGSPQGGQFASHFASYNPSYTEGKIAYYDRNYFRAVKDDLVDDAGKVVGTREKLEPIKPANEFIDRLVPRNPTLLYRGMSSAEYESAVASGVIKSKGDYNIGASQKGLTYYSTDPRAAASYASSFAPKDFKPSPDRPAYVVAVRRPVDEAFRVKGTDEQEVGVRSAVPVSQIAAVYRGTVIAYDPGDRTSRLNWERVGPLIKFDLLKFNPYHDEKGLFASADEASGDFHAADAQTHSPEKLAEKYKAVVAAHNTGLSPPEADALNSYTSGITRQIEAQLRRGEPSDRVRTIADNLDRVIGRSKVPEDLIVYRGGTGEKLGSLKPGDLIEDKGFVSTTLNSTIAAKFARTSISDSPARQAGKTIYRINLPKGSNGYFAYDFARENEVILPRNSVFRVDAVSTRQYRTLTGVSRPIRQVTLTPVRP